MRKKRFANPRSDRAVVVLWCGRLKEGEHALSELHYWSQHLQEASAAFLTRPNAIPTADESPSAEKTTEPSGFYSLLNYR